MYKLNSYFGKNVGVTRLSDGASIPFDPANTDYQAYLKWLSEVNEPLPPDALPVDEPPDEVIE